MDIESAIQQYLVGLKETAPREQVEFDLTVLARLQEYLAADSVVGSVEAIRPGDLLGFIRDWYREGEDVTPEVADRLVTAVTGWARWLDRQAAASFPPDRLAAPLELLVNSLPRTA